MCYCPREGYKVASVYHDVYHDVYHELLSP